MKKIKMYNYQISYIEIFNIVRNLLKNQLDSNYHIDIFKDKISKKLKLDRNKIILTNNVSDAFNILFKTLKINGDIIIPSVINNAILNAIKNVNNKIIFSESEDDLNISLNNIKKVYNKNCKAVIINNYAGVQPDELYRIKGFCREKNITIIEDRSANLIGGKNNHLSDFVVYDFNYDKILNSIEGGMIYVNNKNQKNINELYEYNKISSINAIIGNIKLDKLDKNIEKRINNEKIYNRELEHDFHVPKISQYPKNWYWIRTSKDKKIKILERLKENKIIIEFEYLPLHKNLDFNKENKKLPKTEEIFEQIICLPNHENITEKEIKEICKILKKNK